MNRQGEKNMLKLDFFCIKPAPMPKFVTLIPEPRSTSCSSLCFVFLLLLPSPRPVLIRLESSSQHRLQLQHQQPLQRPQQQKLLSQQLLPQQRLQQRKHPEEREVLMMLKMSWQLSVRLFSLSSRHVPGQNLSPSPNAR